MAIPAALTEAGGAKIFGLLYDNAGTNAFAGFRGISPATVNSTSLAHLGVASHVGAATISSTDPMVLIGGSDGTTARHLLVDATGALVTAAALVDNAVFTDGTSRVTMAGFIFDESAGTALTENDAAAARIDSKRALIGVIEDATTRGQRVAVNSGGALETQGDIAHDGVAAGNPVLLGAYASAAAPTNVSADADVTRLWALRNGALAVNLTAAGALIPGDATNGLDIDVTRLPTTLEMVDNAAFADGTTHVIGAGFIFDESAGTALTENDIGAARMDSKRAVVAVLEDATTRGRRVTVQSTGELSVLDSSTIVDNAGFTDGTSRVAMAGFVFDESAGTALTENDAAAARIDSKRALIGVIEDATTRGQRAGVNAGGEQLVIAAKLGSVTDRSGSITSGGTSQQLAAANTARRYLLVENLDAAAEALWIDFGTAAVEDQPSIKILSGAIFLMDHGFVSTQAVNVRATTTGHKFTAKEG